MVRIVLVTALVFLTASAVAGPSSSDATTRYPPAAVLAAALAVFPDGYRELAKVTYETSGESFYPDTVTFLMPESSPLTTLSPEKLEAKACAAKKKLGLECACEAVDIGPAKDYAWSAWPDKRVVPVTIRFALGC